MRRSEKSLLSAILILLLISFNSTGQNLPKVLILTGNGNVPSYKNGYPPWIHEFHNDKIIEILKSTVTIDVTEDLTILRQDRLRDYELIISNSLFLTPDKEQLNALYQFVSNGKSYLTLHCGILSLLNWDRYEEFIGGIFIGGPSSVPARFNVSTSNTEFWGYKYTFREEKQHPVSIVVDDFIIKDELYHFQPSIRDFNVIARAENLPVMWWHSVGKGKVMSLTLGHDEEAKNNPGYQNLLKHGVQWLTGTPLIYGQKLNAVSTRSRMYENFMRLQAATNSKSTESIVFRMEENSNREMAKIDCTPEGNVKLILSGESGEGKFIVSARAANGASSARAYEFHVVKDGTGNIAGYYGNTAVSSSNENQSSMFEAKNVLDEDQSTRWSSAPADSAWITIDLQKNYPVKKVVLEWEASFATSYIVQGSKDGILWNTITSVSDGNGGTDEIEFNPTEIRFVKIHGTKRADRKWGYSLYDIRVYQK